MQVFVKAISLLIKREEERYKSFRGSENLEDGLFFFFVLDRESLYVENKFHNICKGEMVTVWEDIS